LSKGTPPELESYITFCKASLGRGLRGVYVVDLNAVSIAGMWRKVNAHFVLVMRGGSLLDNYVTWFRGRVLAFLFLMGTVNGGSRVEVPRKGASISITRPFLRRGVKISVEPRGFRNEMFSRHVIGALNSAMITRLQNLFMGRGEARLSFVKVMLGRAGPRSVEVRIASMLEKAPFTSALIDLFLQLREVVERFFMSRIKQQRPRSYVEYLELWPE